MTSVAIANVQDLRRKRWLGAIWTTAMSAGQAAAAAFAQLALFGTASRTLSPSDFGVWTALATLGAWLTLSDIGINKAVTTRWAATLTPQRLAATAFFLQAGVAWPTAVMAGVGFAASSTAVSLTLVIVLAVAPFAVARAILSGAQRGWIPALWDLSGSVLVLLLCATIAPQSRLTGMSLIAASGLCLSRLLGGVWLWRYSPPSVSAVDRMHAEELWRSGRHFVIAQGSDLLLLQGLPWIAILALGPLQAGPFSSAARLVSFLPVAVMLFCNALIPAYADAYARKDHTWIRATLKRTGITTAAITFSVCGLLTLILPELLGAWLSASANLPSRAALIWLTLWAGAQSALTPLLAFLYGTGHVGLAARWNLLSALTGLAAGAAASSTWGPAGLAAVLCLAHVFLYLLPLSARARSLSEARQP